MVGKVVWTTLKLLWIYRPDYKCWKGSGRGGGGWGGGGDFLSEKGMKFSVFMPVKKPHLLLEERAQVYVYRIKSEMDSLKLVVITIIRSWKEIQIRALIVCGGSSAAITVWQNGIVEYMYKETKSSNVSVSFDQNQDYHNQTAHSNFDQMTTKSVKSWWFDQASYFRQNMYGMHFWFSK